MAPEEEIQPQCKRLKHAADPNEHRIYRIDEMFPAIDNLEFFPTEILMPIFAEVDDIGLLRLASVNQRFESIAQVVFKQRYADKYFSLNCCTESCQALYWEQFRMFGDGIKRIQANNQENIDENHWMTRMLQKHGKVLKELYFEDCSFENATDFLSHHLHITHLTLEDVTHNDNLFEMPNHRHLKELSFIDYSITSLQSLEEVIRNNAQLEILAFNQCRHLNLTEIMGIISKHLKHLKELNVLGEYDFGTENPPDSLIDEFVDSLKCVESLGITIDAESIELLRRLSSKCKNIKRLTVGLEGENLDSDLVHALRPLDKVKELSLRKRPYDENVQLLVKCFPHLTSLFINMNTPVMNTPVSFDYILSILRNCTCLENIVINYRCLDEEEPLLFVNMDFYDEFVELAKHPKIKVEYCVDNRTIGIVTRTKVIWRDKLMHWTGYDPVHNHSNLNLLDLADLQTASNADRNNPFDLILGYIDLGSLYSLSRANKRSKLLVENYVQRSSIQQQTFVFTDEFYIKYNINGLRVFRPFINNLKINLMHFDDELLDLMSTHADAPHSNKRHAIRRQIRQLVLYTENALCDFYFMFDYFPNLETIELKERLDKCISNVGLADLRLFRSLKKFTFKPWDVNQAQRVQEFFKNTSIQVVIT